MSDTSYVGPDRRHTARSAMPTLPDDQPARPPSELFDVLWLLHLQIIRTGSYEGAYHVLAGALHCAELVGSLGLVGEVERIAAYHQQGIDAIDPSHPLSTAAAQTRGTGPIFASLSATARAMRARMRADLVLKDRLPGGTRKEHPARGADK
jgi:hypothetical protein